MSAARMGEGAPRLGLDRFGTFWSGLCALHCATFWALATWGVLGEHGAEEEHEEHGGWAEQLELGMVAIAVVIAAVAIGRGTARHRDRRPMILGGLGLAALIAARLLEQGEMLLSILGAITLIGAPLLNLRALRRAAACC